MFMYGILFYLFLNKMLKLEILLGVISLKFILTTVWVFKLRRKEKNSAEQSAGDQART
jgi:hypothetical protein